MDACVVSIRQNVDLTIVLPDGSRNTGETRFTSADGSTEAVGSAAPPYDPIGYAVDQTVTVTTDGSGNRTVAGYVRAADGSLTQIIESATSADRNSVAGR